MAFERSPGLDGTPRHRGLITWIFNHKRSMYIASAIASGLLIAMLTFLLIGNQQPDPVVGGLDGCITSANGPVAATVKIADQTAVAQEDGCFFFASVPPGDHPLTLHLDDGSVIQREVTIVPGQATMLGNITVAQ